MYTHIMGAILKDNEWIIILINNSKMESDLLIIPLINYKVNCLLDVII